LILDEVENYVAPGEIQPFFRKLLDAAAEANKQVIVISHHPESIDYLAADSVYRLWRDPIGGHTRIGKLEPDLDSGETAYARVKRGESDA
jgi:ABC-type multidrug transport system ATPase subunit